MLCVFYEALGAELIIMACEIFFAIGANFFIVAEDALAGFVGDWEGYLSVDLF